MIFSFIIGDHFFGSIVEFVKMITDNKTNSVNIVMLVFAIIFLIILSGHFINCMHNLAVRHHYTFAKYTTKSKILAIAYYLTGFIALELMFIICCILLEVAIVHGTDNSSSDSSAFKELRSIFYLLFSVILAVIFVTRMIAGINKKPKYSNIINLHIK